MRTSRIVAVALASVGVLTAVTRFPVGRARLAPVVHAQSGCSDSTLRGTWGGQFNGTIVGFGPIAGVALITYDGAGNFTQTDNVNINGSVIAVNRPGYGTYTVNSNCTGTSTLNLPGLPPGHGSFVIVGNGKEIIDVTTDPGAVITAVSRPVGSVDE